MKHALWWNHEQKIILLLLIWTKNICLILLHLCFPSNILISHNWDQWNWTSYQLSSIDHYAPNFRESESRSFSDANISIIIKNFWLSTAVVFDKYVTGLPVTLLLCVFTTHRCNSEYFWEVKYFFPSLLNRFLTVLSIEYLFPSPQMFFPVCLGWKGIMWGEQWRMSKWEGTSNSSPQSNKTERERERDWKWRLDQTRIYTWSDCKLLTHILGLLDTTVWACVVVKLLGLSRRYIYCHKKISIHSYNLWDKILYLLK